MLLKPILAALVVAACAVTPATADPVGVNQCTATSSNNTRATCTFVAQSGRYRLSISATSVRYAWARVICTPGDYIYVNIEGTGSAFKIDYIEQGGVCTREVAADGGFATGSVHPA